MANNTRITARKRRRSSREQIDVAAILTKPVKVRRNGQVKLLAPFEIELHALVNKAIKEKSLNAIRTLIEVGLIYDLVTAPPPLFRGGVLVVQGRLTKESWAALFDAPENSDIEKKRK